MSLRLGAGRIRGRRWLSRRLLRKAACLRRGRGYLRRHIGLVCLRPWCRPSHCGTSSAGPGRSVPGASVAGDRRGIFRGETQGQGHRGLGALSGTAMAVGPIWVAGWSRKLPPTPQLLLGVYGGFRRCTEPIIVAEVDAIDELERGRESYARRAWLDAYTSLSRADQASPLGAEDLELLATASYMLGRDDEYLSALERAHHAYLYSSGEAIRAVRCAFWVGANLALRGEMRHASGWSRPRPAAARTRGA